MQEVHENGEYGEQLRQWLNNEGQAKQYLLDIRQYIAGHAEQFFVRLQLKLGWHLKEASILQPEKHISQTLASVRHLQQFLSIHLALHVLLIVNEYPPVQDEHILLEEQIKH